MGGGEGECSKTRRLGNALAPRSSKVMPSHYARQKVPLIIQASSEKEMVLAAEFKAVWLPTASTPTYVPPTSPTPPAKHALVHSPLFLSSECRFQGDHLLKVWCGPAWVAQAKPWVRAAQT